MKKIKFVKQNRKNFKAQEVKLSKLAYDKMYDVFMKEANGLYSASHVEDFKNALTIFFSFLREKRIKFISKLNLEIMFEFISYISHYKMNYRQLILSALRNFFKFLYLNQYTERNLIYIVPKLKSIRNNSIPHTVWTQEEIKNILKSIDITRATGKRNYAMLTLMAYLGLRLVDVKYLKFSNIDWKNNKIQLTQHKTKKYVEVPLLNNIGDAIIDYIKNGRPNFQSPYIFLNHQPVREIAMGNDYYNTFQKYLSLANIDTSNKTLKGVHSLRHSLATTLLQNKVNLSTISSILGHTNPDSTSVYLKTDIINLRKCCIKKEGIYD